MSNNSAGIERDALLGGLIVGFCISVAAAVIIYRRTTQRRLFQEEPREPVPWRLADAVVCFLLQVGGVELLASLLMGTRAQLRHSTSGRLIANLIAAAFVLGLVVLYLRLASGARGRDFGFHSQAISRKFLQGMAGCAIALPVVYLIHAVAVQVWNPQSHLVQKMIEEDRSIATAVLVLVGAVLVAPVVEEVVFRGVLLASVWKALPARSARWTTLGNIVVSLIFAGMHAAQWPAPIPLFALSLVLGELYRRTGSLLPPIVAHACFNGLSALALLFAA